MPKVPSSRRVRAQNSTAERRARAARVEQESLEMNFRFYSFLRKSGRRCSVSVKKKS
ncbi:hypothetical protein DDE83_009122 [Stemphylium lycopersici]|uniref:Uncharacterized protein n=1 Tax=Stemphylium lycopersici TaxID=183478 RepID=A0A364MRJ2_STELY|nr:hypothetical protein DDE83_009122 [Stemphylium lycopersici]